jgi:hypothetical protein
MTWQSSRRSCLAFADDVALLFPLSCSNRRPSKTSESAKEKGKFVRGIANVDLVSGTLQKCIANVDLVYGTLQKCSLVYSTSHQIN